MIKKILISILLLLTFASQGWATTWYAGANCASGTMSSCNWYSTQGSSCTNGTGPLTWNNQVAGDTFNANGCVAIAVDVDPQGTGGSKGKVILNTPAGGTFVVSTIAGNRTFTADLGVVGNTGTTTVLAVSGTNTYTLTILGNIYGGGTASAYGLSISGTTSTIVIGANGSPVTIIGGSAAACNGVYDSHTTGTSVTVYANITGGSNGTARGYYQSAATGTISFIGNVTGGASEGIYLGQGGTATLTGNCIGSGSTGVAVGCRSTSGLLTVTGSLIWGGGGAAGNSAPICGNVQWTPVTPGSGTGSYIEVPTTTAVYVGLPDSSPATHILTSGHYINSTSGTGTAGGASAGGGGCSTGY